METDIFSSGIPSKDLHILDQVDGDAGLADIADDAFVIRS